MVAELQNALAESLIKLSTLEVPSHHTAASIGADSNQVCWKKLKFRGAEILILHAFV